MRFLKEFRDAMIFVAFPLAGAAALGIGAGWAVMNYPGVSGFAVGILVMAVSSWLAMALLDKLSRKRSTD